MTYFVTFRYQRDLVSTELSRLFLDLLKLNRQGFNISALICLPDHAELIFTVGPEGSANETSDGMAPRTPFEFSRPLEKAKQKAGKEIIKKSGEKWSPFYGESYDRIIRDDAELEERYLAIIGAAEEASASEVEEYPFLWIAGKI